MFQPCGFSTAPWFGRRGPTERELSRLRCGKTPHRCKSRSAGERALRYIPSAPDIRPLVPHSPCGTPGRASPASRDCIHPFERRLRLCDPEVATANSPWELTVGSSSKEKSTVAEKH